MKRVIVAFHEIMKILYADAPIIVIATFVSAFLTGAIAPIAVWVNGQILNAGLSVASGETAFADFMPYLALFVVMTLLPVIVGDFFVDSYITPRCQLVLRTSYKGKMLQKLKRLKYEHLESEMSMEIIDKAFNRTEYSAGLLLPHYARGMIIRLLSVGGMLYLLASVKWWLILTVLLPFFLQTWLARKSSANIYNEMEKYWKQERFYLKLTNMLRSREYIKENRLLCASGYLIDAYRDRLNARNRSLTINHGERVSIVGENGEGKTTMVKLLGLFKPDGGEQFDNLVQIEAKQLKYRYPLTDRYVLDGIDVIIRKGEKVALNVYLGDTGRPRDEASIDAALSFSGMDGVDKSGLLGKDIGGTELSGGQWQKLTIARAQYRCGDLIILDEPTSNLDPLAETDIFKKYIALAENKTVIFVTHRISVASLADRIIVFLNGKIAQDGTHDELINAEGEYSRLYNEQAKWYNRR